MDQNRWITSVLQQSARGARLGWGWDRVGGWRGACVLLAALVLPFGWLLPVAPLARVKVAARRVGPRG